MRKYWILTFLAILLVLFAAMPYLFAIQPLKSIITKRVEKRIGGNVAIDRVRFSWKGPQKLEGVHISTAQINGVIEEVSSTVPFWQVGSFGDRIEQISGSGTTLTDGGKGNFSIDATRLPSNEISVTFSAAQMPTQAILTLLKVSQKLYPLIGPNFNAKGTALLQDNAGRLDLDLSSSKMQGSIKAKATPEAITLCAPFTLTFYLTPELTQGLTKGSLSVMSKTPTYLRIDPKGFFFPRSGALDKIRIEKGSLDLGRSILEHANLSLLANLLRADSLTASQIDMWLTNTDFSLKKGVLTLGRIDALLADSIHLCAWGTANLTKEQLDMIFGIPADTLTKSLRLKNIPSTYVLQIPVTGPFATPNIDVSTATAKIAMLVAGNQAQKQGGVLGGVATILGKASEEKSPPPKRPFPWE